MKGQKVFGQVLSEVNADESEGRGGRDKQIRSSQWAHRCSRCWWNCGPQGL